MIKIKINENENYFLQTLRKIFPIKESFSIGSFTKCASQHQDCKMDSNKTTIVKFGRNDQNKFKYKQFRGTSKVKCNTANHLEILHQKR